MKKLMFGFLLMVTIPAFADSYSCTMNTDNGKRFINIFCEKL